MKLNVVGNCHAYQIASRLTETPVEPCAAPCAADLPIFEKDLRSEKREGDDHVTRLAQTASATGKC